MVCDIASPGLPEFPPALDRLEHSLRIGVLVRLFHAAEVTPAKERLDILVRCMFELGGCLPTSFACCSADLLPNFGPPIMGHRLS